MAIRTRLMRLALLGSTSFVGSVALLVAHANESPYDAETVVAYLGSKDHVFIGARLDGGISLGNISAMLTDVGAEQFANETFEAIRLEDRALYSQNRILVLRNLKGMLPAIIDVSADRDVADSVSMPLGEPVLVFADEDDGELTFEICEIAPLSIFPPELIQRGNPQELIDYIRDHRALCLREPIRVESISE